MLTSVTAEFLYNSLTKSFPRFRNLCSNQDFMLKFVYEETSESKKMLAFYFASENFKRPEVL